MSGPLTRDVGPRYMKIIAAIICLGILTGAARADDPPELQNLAIAAIRPIPFYIRYNETNLPIVGTEVLGYKVVEVTTYSINLTRISDGRPVTVVKGRPVTEQELAVLFVDISNRTSYPTIHVGKEISIGTQRFTLQSIKSASCTLRDVNSGELLTITNTINKATLSNKVQQGVAGYPPQGVGSPER